MIAGIAVARDEPVVTRNAEEFSRTPARVSPYWWVAAEELRAHTGDT